MVTDDERRRVAAALRAYDGKGADVDTIGEVMAIIIGAGDFEGWSWREVFDRLADLIYPDTTGDTTKRAADTTKCSCDATATHTDASATCDMSQSCRDTVACDRKALLALAGYLDAMSLGGWASGPVNVGEVARRIREACGEVVA